MGKFRLLLALAFLALTWEAAPGQTRPVPQGVPGGVPGDQPEPVPPQAPTSISAIAGAPFSGEIMWEFVITDHDGTVVTQGNISGRVYRDWQGRIRSEQIEKSRAVEVFICDPVAKLSYTLGTGNKIAHLSPIMATSARLSPSVIYFPISPPSIRTEPRVVADFKPQRGTVSLGIKQLEGLAVEGARLDIGRQGSDGSFETTFENWVSKELNVIVFWTMYSPPVAPGPGGMKLTWKLTNIRRDEPDSSLFQAPADYKFDDPQRKL